DAFVSGYGAVAMNPRPFVRDHTSSARCGVNGARTFVTTSRYPRSWRVWGTPPDRRRYHDHADWRSKYPWRRAARYSIASIAARRYQTFPFDFDIFRPPRARWPMIPKPRGPCSGGNRASWTKIANVMWFWIRSFPVWRRSTGYQYVNSRRRPCRTFGATL